MGSNVEWIDRILDEITTKRDHYNLLQRAWNLKKKIEQLDQERQEEVRRLGEIDDEMFDKD